MDPPPALDRAGKRNVGDAFVRDQVDRLVVGEDQVLNQVAERLTEMSAAQGRAGAVLDQHGVARKQGRGDHVDRDQQRVVPRGDVEYNALRCVLDAQDESVLGRRRVRSQRFGCVAHRLLGPGEHRLHLAPRLGDRLTHLASQVRGDGIGVVVEVDQRLAHALRSPGQRLVCPTALHRLRLAQLPIDLVRRVERQLGDGRSVPRVGYL